MKEREDAVDMLGDLVAETVKDKVDAVVGGETAGIPYAARYTGNRRAPLSDPRKWTLDYNAFVGLPMTQILRPEGLTV
ncbi:MAG: hypothetical protein ACOX5Q_01905 [Bacillota bacterium]|nr:hypothetical protein [Candidatus Fermentithermobacillaceae bacterium]